MKASTEQINGAMKAAYLRAGVEQFSIEDGIFISPVQHSAKKAKELADTAVHSLVRKGLEVESAIVRSQSGAATYGIRLS